MANIIYAAEEYPKNHPCSVFLAGSIDLGKAVDWQKSLCSSLNDYDIVILNPRRKSWDASWEQSIDNPLFTEQVNWELDALEHATYIVMHLASGSKAPISLLELGLFANSQKIIVSCAANFWRRGNVEVVCSRYNIPLFSSISEVEKILKHRFQKQLQTNNSQS